MLRHSQRKQTNKGDAMAAAPVGQVGQAKNERVFML